MRIHVADTFACAPEDFWEVFFDPAFEAELLALARMRSELLHEARQGPVVVRRVRMHTEARPPAWMRRVVGDGPLVYEQVHRIHRAESWVDWEVVPPVMPERITAAGRYRVDPHPEGCIRTMQGEVRVGVPVVGPRVERMIERSVDGSYRQGTALLRTWIARRKGG